MQTHLAPRALLGKAKPDGDVQALFATEPDRKAVLFIHGFSGDPIRTWSDFHLLLPSRPLCQGRDLFFYGYDGLRAEMTASAALFRDFLDRLLGDTGSVINASLPHAAKRPDDFAYAELVVVAHSLGAVITRRALLDATRTRRPWAPRLKLVFFAPAHKGAKVAELALEAAGGFRFLSLFSALARFQSPLIDQLKPGSADLNALLEETREFAMVARTGTWSRAKS